MQVIVAITGASGSIYGRRTVEELLKAGVHVGLIVSPTGKQVAQYEEVSLDFAHPHLERFAADDFFASPASGSAQWDAMVVVPCSMGTAGRIAAGTSNSLIERAADVMLKERRRLILVLREMPLSLIHLRNLTTLTEAGAVILPASPSFYSHPTTVDALINTVIERITAQLGISGERFEWGK